MRSHLAAAAALFALACAYLPWSVSGHLGNLDGDNAIYQLTARHFAPYVPAEAVAARAAGQSQFPPLYPLLLAATGAAADVRVAHAVTALCLLAALAALYAWLLAIGIAPGAAAAGMTLFGLLPGTWLMVLSLQSEPLYLALSLAGLALLASPVARPRTLALAALVIGAAILCRTVGVALLPALAVVLWRRRPRRAPWMFLLAVAPAVAWSLLHRTGPGYLAEFAGVSFALPELLAWLASNLADFAMGAGENVLQGQGPVQLALLGVLGLLALVTRGLRPGADLAYLAAYATLIAAWPYPTHAARFAWVIVPLLLGYAFLAMQFLQRTPPMRGTAPGRGLPAALSAAVLLLIAPALLSGLARWRDPEAAAQPELRHLPAWYEPDAAAARRESLLQWHLISGMRALGADVPEGECLLSIGWPTVSYYTGRITYELPDESADEEQLLAEIVHRGCRHFLLVGVPNPIVPTPFYPADRLAGQLTPVAGYRAQIGGGERTLLVLARREAGARSGTPAPNQGR